MEHPTSFQVFNPPGRHLNHDSIEFLDNFFSQKIHETDKFNDSKNTSWYILVFVIVVISILTFSLLLHFISFYIKYKTQSPEARRKRLLQQQQQTNQIIYEEEIYGKSFDRLYFNLLPSTISINQISKICYNERILNFEKSSKLRSYPCFCHRFLSCKHKFYVCCSTYANWLNHLTDSRYNQTENLEEAVKLKAYKKYRQAYIQKFRELNKNQETESRNYVSEVEPDKIKFERPSFLVALATDPDDTNSLIYQKSEKSPVRRSSVIKPEISQVEANNPTSELTAKTLPHHVTPTQLLEFLTEFSCIYCVLQIEL